MVGLELVDLAPVWVQVQRHEMDSAFDSKMAHSGDELIAGDPNCVVKPNNIELPGVKVTFSSRGWQNGWEVPQLFVVACRYRRPPFLALPGSAHQFNADCGRKVGLIVSEFERA